MAPAVEPVASQGQQEATIQDDEDAWETLDTPTTPMGSTSSQTGGAIVSSSQLSTSAARQLCRGGNSSSARSDTIRTLQRRVETRRTLQRNLVGHPLQIFWSHFLWHLAQEFWKVDAKIRVAVLLLALGAGCKIFMIMTWYLWYPKLIFSSIVLLISYVYLYPDDLPRRIEGFLEHLTTMPHRIPEALEHMNAKQARIVFLVCFFIPTLLQSRTITALANINATGGSFLWTFLVPGFMAGTSLYLIKPPRSMAARDISHICLIVLYGSALCITLLQFKIMTLPRLMAPFFTGAGTILLAYEENDNMEWCSTLARSALRQTLRDVLASVGTAVQEDEMLQLALLRWLVDYWNYTPPTAQPPQSSSSSTANEPFPDPSAPPATDELQIIPMLKTTTDQMTSEVHTLQHQPPVAEATTPGPGVGGSTGGTNSSSPTTPGPGVGGSTGGTNSSSPPDSSLDNLHSMLASMNVDGRAKPAVEAYKRNVEELPPSRDVALLISIVRRCPACHALVWQLLVASMFQSTSVSLRMILMLLPMIALEVIRIQAWLKACESLSRVLDVQGVASPAESATSEAATTEPESTGLLSSILPGADPMTILLSADDDMMKASVVTDADESTTAVTTKTKIPTLLVVWRNMKSSVSALEASLTAARCVQTGAVAVDFAKNVISLAEFGSEVSRHGWMHGLTLIVKEVVFDHQGDINRSAATYTHAAVSSVRNAQRVAHNLGMLAEEDGQVGQIVGPLVGFFGFVGSLFDRDKKGDDNEQDHAQGGVSGENESVAEGSANMETEEDISTLHSKADEPGLSTEEDEEWEATVESNQEAETGSISAPHTSRIVEEEATTPPPPTPSVPEEKGDAAEAVRSDEAKAATESEGNEAGVAETAGVANAPRTELELTASKNLEEEKIAQPSAVDEKGGKSSEAELTASVVEESKVDPASSASVEQPKVTEDKPIQSRVDEQETTEELGVVMELIADAYERSLIDESEKNEFCLKLSSGGKDKDFVLGMKATLQGLIRSHYQSEPHAVVSASQSTPVVDTRCLSPAQGDETSGAINTPMTSDGGWSPIAGSSESEEATIQPLDYSERLASAVRTREALAAPQVVEGESSTLEGDGIPTVESSAPYQSADDDDNMWVKVGSGIAVLGAAVVGGALLAMHQDNPNNNASNRNANQTSSGSRVTIERLDDEEEAGNEWESTDADRQAQ